MREEKKESHQHHQHDSQKQQQSHHHSQQQQQSHHHSQQQLQSHHHSPAEPPRYGTFQGVPHHPPQPAIGFPQPAPPPGATAHPPQYYAHGYQAIPGSVVAEGTPVRQSRLPCCGCGCGWFLFIIGFLLAAIPWYVAAFILLCGKIDPREKPGYIACAVAAVLATIAVIFGLTYDG